MNPSDDSSADPASGGSMSLGARFLNVFVDPVELFEHLIRAPLSHVNWVLPILLNCVAGILFAVAAFSMPPVLQDLRDQQSKALDAQVSAGKITGAQRDQAEAFLEKMSPLMAPLVGASMVVGILIYNVLAATAVWLIGTRALGAELGFGKSLEIVGLSGLVGLLGFLVKYLLVMIRGSINASANPAFFMPNLTQGTPLATFLTGCDLFIWWPLALLAVGLSIASKRSGWVAAGWIFSLWLVVLLLFTGLAAVTSAK